MQELSAIEKRLVEELTIGEKKCGCFDCTNQATHTEGGHPVCDECAWPDSRYRKRFEAEQAKEK